jgi:hypothetical protein
LAAALMGMTFPGRSLDYNKTIQTISSGDVCVNNNVAFKSTNSPVKDHIKHINHPPGHFSRIIVDKCVHNPIYCDRVCNSECK